MVLLKPFTSRDTRRRQQLSTGGHLFPPNTVQYFFCSFSAGCWRPVLLGGLATPKLRIQQEVSLSLETRLLTVLRLGDRALSRFRPVWWNRPDLLLSTAAEDPQVQAARDARTRAAAAVVVGGAFVVCEARRSASSSATTASDSKSSSKRVEVASTSTPRRMRRRRRRGNLCRFVSRCRRENGRQGLDETATRFGRRSEGSRRRRG